MPWWLYAISAVVIIAAIIYKIAAGRSDERQLDRIDLSAIRGMNWREFEHFLGNLFKALGYKAEVTPGQLWSFPTCPGARQR